MNGIRVSLLTIAMAIGASAPAAYARLYAVSGSGGASSTLYELDPSNGAVVATIGPTGFSHVTGIACQPATGVMYAVANDSQRLLKIDKLTGAGTAVGPTGEQIPDIAFSPAGTLYGWSEGGGVGNDDLITIDLATGSPTLVGDCSCSTARTGLAFNSTGSLFMSAGGTLNVMNVGAGTIASTVPLSDTVDNMLAFDRNDVLYSARRSGGFMLKTIDPVTGTVTPVGGNALSNISAIAFCDDDRLDHFMFYKRKTTPGTPKFYGFGPITLADQFGTASYTVMKPSLLGLPADKNLEGVLDPVTHLEAYKLKPITPFIPIPSTRLVNQCNDIVVEVKKPVSLLVPTNKGLGVPVSPPSAQNHLDHFLCYRVKAQSSLPKKMQVDVVDQFSSERYDLKKITKLCNPVAKSGTPAYTNGPNKGDPKPITPATIKNAIRHLVCYKAKVAKKFFFQPSCGLANPADPGLPFLQPPVVPISGGFIHTNNQFGPEQHDTNREAELCIPSYKDPVCGDNLVDQPSETCDGSDNAACGGLPCLPGCTCTPPSCGDGIVNQVSETCDGAQDAACGGLPCLPGCTCTPPSCGDGIVNQVSETCDGAADGACPGDCLADCTCAVCGNNVAEAPAEECDGTDDSACPGMCGASCACGVTEDLTTCSPPTFDTWQFTVGAGQLIHARADTIDAATAADLCFSVSCPSGFFGADDNAACTFPPPAYACPEAFFLESTGGTCTLTLQLCSSACANPATANYFLSVSVDGVPTSLTLTGDDQ